MKRTPQRPAVVGVDFGTSSVRAVILDAASGDQLSSAEAGFPRWEAGEYCDPAQARFRQHPAEQIESFCSVVSKATAGAGSRASSIAAIGIDTTGSTPCAVDGTGRPLSLLPQFADDPDAMSILWKDHSAQAEAEEISAAARAWPDDDYLRFCGGAYSAEWYWAKVLHALRCNPRVAAAAEAWLEHCDWIAAMLIGATRLSSIARSACAAGHKALWNPAFGGYPPERFFAAVDPKLAAVRRVQPEAPRTSDRAAGRLVAEWAERLGLPVGIPVGVGLFDAHAGALGAGVRPGTVVKVMGTSSSEMVVAPVELIGERAIAGIESQALGSMIPSMIGIEAGQSAFGDVYAWFRDLLAWPLQFSQPADAAVVDRLIPELSKRAALLADDDGPVVATDWFNGRRAPVANHALKASLTGLTLGSRPEHLFRALVEATAFGTRAIHELLKNEQVPIERVIAIGGIPKKAPYVMQVLADVLETPVAVSGAENGSARGAALLASVVAGIHTDVEAAIAAIGGTEVAEYRPRPQRLDACRTRYRRYLELGKFSEALQP